MDAFYRFSLRLAFITTILTVGAVHAQDANGPGSSCATGITAGAEQAHNNALFRCTTTGVTQNWYPEPLYIGESTALCDASTASLLRYNSGSLEVCNGSAWVTAGSGGVLGSSAAATSPQRSGEAGTGLFSPATGVVAVASLGTEALRVTATGSIGIGTTTPTQPLHVHAATWALARFTNTTSGSADSDGLAVGYDGSTGGAAIWNRENTQLIFATNNTERMMVAANGNVGIGTNAPGGTLSVVSGNTTGGGSSAALSLTADSLTSGDGLYVKSSSLQNGNLAHFSVSGTAAAGNGQATLWAETSGANANATQTTYGGYFENTHTGTASTNVAFFASASGGTNNYAALFPAGNVGIGTTAPGAQLEVDSKADATVGAIIKANSATTSADLLEIQDSTGAVLTKINNGGSLFVGGSIWVRSSVTPNSAYLRADSFNFSDIAYTHFPLTVNTGGNNPAVAMQQWVTGYPTLIVKAMAAQTGNLQEWQDSAGTALSVVTPAGNVGIGTTSPQSTLHVPDGKYAQFEDNNAGAPPAGDCDNNAERGRMSIDTTNNRLYICNGATRGWDYVALTD